MTKAPDFLAPIIRHSDFVILSSFGIWHSALAERMRFRFKPNFEQRTALRAQLARLRQPVAALEVLRSVLPTKFKPASVACTIEGLHKDRFVLRAQVRSGAGEERSFALKAYSDDFGERVWAHGQTLAASISENPASRSR